MKDIIKDFSQTRSESFRDHLLPSSWIQGDGSPQTISNFSNGFIPIQRAKMIFPTHGQEPIFVFLGLHAPDLIEHFISHTGNVGRNVYVLGNLDQLSEGRAARIVQHTQSNVLFRRIHQLWISGIIIGGNKGGFFLSSDKQQSAKWWMPLDEAQAKSAFQYGLRLFWHHALDEGWTENHSTVKFQSPRERPFDIPLASTDAPIHEYQDEKLTGTWAWYDPHREFPNKGIYPQYLFIPPSGSDHKTLKNFVLKNTQVLWTDLGFPQIILNDSDGFLKFEAFDNELLVSLNQKQFEDLRSILSKSAEAPEWTFELDKTLAEIHSKVFIPNATRAEEVKDNVNHSLGNLQAPTLRAMPDTEPSSLPELHPLIRSVNWIWKVTPPRAPQQARKDGLYRAWKKVDQTVQNELSSLKNKLQEHAQKTNALKQNYQEIRHSILGFERKRSKVLRQIEVLESQIPSTLGTEKTESLLESLELIKTDVLTLIDETNASEQEVKRKRAYEKQNKAFEKRQAQASQNLSNYKKSLKDQEKALDSKQKELNSIDKQLKKAKQFQKSFTQTTLKKEKTLKSQKSNQKKAQKEAAQKVKDLKVQKQRIKDEIRRLEREINKLKAKIAHEEEILKEEFVFNPPQSLLAPKKSSQSSSARFVPQSNSTSTLKIQVPKESLPSVGSLLTYQKKRYLVITQWSELDLGENEAQRLNAALVAPAKENR